MSTPEQKLKARERFKRFIQLIGRVEYNRRRKISRDKNRIPLFRNCKQCSKDFEVTKYHHSYCTKYCAVKKKRSYHDNIKHRNQAFNNLSDEDQQRLMLEFTREYMEELR